MSDVYLQVELDDATKKLLVVNTDKGLFQYNRLSLGPAPATGAGTNFQQGGQDQPFPAGDSISFSRWRHDRHS